MLEIATSTSNPLDYLPPPNPENLRLNETPPPPPVARAPHLLDWATVSEHVLAYTRGKGFSFDPWQIASFISAARTRPFIMLAGISGTGKSQLPRLIAEATRSECVVVPVRPDWTDSADLLGFERLDGQFTPGRLLQMSQDALKNPQKQYFFILDEMNIARAEYYFAEVLSVMESRGRRGLEIFTDPLLPTAPEPWNEIGLPSNLCLIGTVNMDETTNSFSRKVLDRAFVLEMSSVDLSSIDYAYKPVGDLDVPSEFWKTPYIRLAELPTPAENATVIEAVKDLVAINEFLELAQLQVGYRVRDEVALFCINAEGVTTFVDDDEEVVSPTDLSIMMKILPRLQGSGSEIGAALDNFLHWVNDPLRSSTYIKTRQRLQLMASRLATSGFTSYWL